MNNSITEIERAAMTLLANEIEHITNPVIREYTQSLLSNCGLVAWIPDGHHPNDMDRAFDYTQCGSRSDNVRAKLTDEAVANLAGAVALYRSGGRPTGDTTTIISSMSGIGITSSLAAAVVDFHNAMIHTTCAWLSAKRRNNE